MSALEMVSAQVTAPGAGGAAMAAVSGNSLQIRNTHSQVHLLAIGLTQQAVAGLNRITSPLLHDTTIGISTIPVISTAVIQTLQVPQQLQPQDTLSLFRTGSGTAGDIEQTTMFIHYDSLPGTEAKLIGIRELMARGEDLYCWNNSVTLTGGGGYTGSQAINATQDQLKANRDYAIIGMTFTSSTATAAIRLVGPDWGNLGVGIPNLSQDADVMARWFPHLTEKSGRDCIPVFNAANKALTFISGLANENGAAVSIGLVAVLLAPTGAGHTRTRGAMAGNAMSGRSGKSKAGCC